MHRDDVWAVRKIHVYVHNICYSAVIGLIWGVIPTVGCWTIPIFWRRRRGVVWHPTRYWDDTDLLINERSCWPGLQKYSKNNLYWSACIEQYLGTMGLNERSWLAHMYIKLIWFTGSRELGVNRLPARQFPSIGAIQMDDTGGWTAMLDSSGRAWSGTSKYSTKKQKQGRRWKGARAVLVGLHIIPPRWGCEG